MTSLFFTILSVYIENLSPIWYNVMQKIKRSNRYEKKTGTEKDRQILIKTVRSAYGGMIIAYGEWSSASQNGNFRYAENEGKFPSWWLGNFHFNAKSVFLKNVYKAGRQWYEFDFRQPLVWEAVLKMPLDNFLLFLTILSSNDIINT